MRSTPFHKYAGIRTPLHPLRPRSAPSTYSRSTTRSRALPERRFDALGAQPYSWNEALREMFLSSGRKAGFFRLALLSVLLAVALAATPLTSPALASDSSLAQAEKSWDFERFDTDIQVHPDATFTVRETQVANFRGSFSFLNRDISTGGASFSDGVTHGRVRVSDIQVYDLDGNPYENWSVESYDGGKTVGIAFSATNEQKGWIIEYRMSGAIIFSTDYDRLYWDAVSYERAVPIKSSQTTVRLPAGADMEEVQTEFYVNRDSPPGSTEFGRDGDTLWWSATDIPPSTTVTIDVAFPKGLVQVPLPYRSWFGILMLVLSVSIFLVLLAGMLILWWKKGRDVGRPELDVVRYEPPEGLKPAMVGLLVNERQSPEDFSATVVDLAIRGKLTIFEEEKGKVFKGKRYGFRRKDPSDSDLLPYERKILDGLFEEGDVVTEDDLKNKFYVHIKDIDKGITREVKERGLFSGDPKKVRLKYTYLMVAVMIPLPILLGWLWSSYDLGYVIVLLPGFLLGGISVGAVGHYMPSRTPKGSEALSWAMGFKEYMKTAERDEMEFMTPETFQENLPYAMVLDVADSWADKFSDIYTTPPDWYEGSYATFSTVYLVSSLDSMSHSVSTTFASSPSSGGGGFGGGSSGGGFGGGGSSAG